MIDSTIYVSANTVYKYGSTRVTNIGDMIPVRFVHNLQPINPNPAKGKVQIEFDINTHRTNTVLEVICLDGRKTYPVMSGYLEPGHYTYQWDGANAAAGNYIVWLGTDEIPVVQKFVLCK